MAKQIITYPGIGRDGTSQTARMLPALDPDYVSVDERSLKDLLRFAREYGKELKYFNEKNQAMGDWRGFIDDDLDLDELLSFIQDPATLPSEKRDQFSRPHLTLFLSFLKLLQEAQKQLNTLTQRHLDFYYQEVLRMQKKPGVPDQVNMLLKPQNQVTQVMIPAGTSLNAGPDAIGKDRLYQTDEDLVVSQAQVEKLSTVYAEKEMTGIREARESNLGTAEERFVQMLEIALGHPLPGDPFPQNQILQGTNAVVDFDYLRALGQLTAFSETGLFMPIFDLRSLMKFKRQRDDSSEEWDDINGYLEIAARKKRGNPAFQFNPTHPRDFDASLIEALEGAPNYGGITQVTHIDHVYAQRDLDEVKAFIRDKLYFDNREDFLAMMRLKLKIDKEWDAINQILEIAGQNKRNKPSYRLSPEKRDDFSANLRKAIGRLPSPLIGRFTDIDAYYSALEQVESDFYMSAESFNYFISVGTKENPSAWEWKKVDEILLEAHQQKIYVARRAALQGLRESQGFTAMLHFALGEDPGTAESDPLSRLKSDVKKEADYTFLENTGHSEKSGTVSASDWRRVYQIVEIAQRFHEGFIAPHPYKEAWVNLYPAADATQVQALRVEDETEESPRWETFGKAQQGGVAETRPDPVFGWGMSSPLFALEEGVRVITVTLGFKADTFFIEKLQPLFPELTEKASSGQGPFQVEISTEKGWIVPDTLEIKFGTYAALSQGEDLKLQAMQLKLHFSEGVDPIAAFPEALPQSPWPLLRIMMRQIWDAERQQFITRYAPLKGLKLLKTHVSVAVSGLSTIYLENDQNTLDSKKPFEPFGGSPAVGAQFYIGHPELFQKQLDSIQFQVEWMGVPKKLKDHYKNYGIDAKLPFTTELSMLDRRVKRPLKNKVNLFASMTNADATYSFQVPSAAERNSGKKLADLLSVAGGFQYERDLQGAFAGELTDWSRYFQWELKSPDFQHGRYPIVSTEQALALSAAISNKVEGSAAITPSDYQVNPPYTPKIKKLTLGYTASVEVILATAGTADHDVIFHLHPFGYSALRTEGVDPGVPFLPQYDHEGELYLGIKALQPPQNLSLLFQMAEGSADPDLVPAAVSWHVLSGNRWVDLQDGNILSDTTRGLINSGIVRFSLAPVLANTQLPGDLYWIRASIPMDANSVCDTVAIHAQAVSASFVDKENDPNHLNQPLAAESISDLRIPLPEITEAIQPYTSFGGKAPEAEAVFYTRVSERLRHKQRALSIWDYERLVLEHFPEIYKVKCLPARLSTHLEDPGRINIIVIPDIRNKRPFNPFAPKAPADLIAAIAEYLSDKHPPSANITVKNAHYVAVKARFGVRFEPGVDVRYHKKIINEALKRFLSPWAYAEGSDIVIGGKIYANSIINFLDRQPYVDYVVEMKLFSSENGVDFKLALPSGDEGYYVTTDRPDGVLVAAQTHEIDLISDAGYEEKSFAGLNYMKVELDFIVG